MMDQIYKAAKQSGTVSKDSGVPFAHEYEKYLGKNVTTLRVISIKMEYMNTVTTRIIF
jgi:hypothetical protein